MIFQPTTSGRWRSAVFFAKKKIVNQARQQVARMMLALAADYA
jgi:hypothetical protein